MLDVIHSWILAISGVLYQPMVRTSVPDRRRAVLYIPV